VRVEAFSVGQVVARLTVDTYAQPQTNACHVGVDSQHAPLVVVVPPHILVVPRVAQALKSQQDLLFHPLSTGLHKVM